MRKVNCKIKGLKRFGEREVVDRKVGHSNSYDVGYRLCHTLRLYCKRFCEDEDIVIYPSAWYDKFLEVTLRDKNHVDGNQRVDYGVLMEIVSNFLPDDWECFDKSWDDQDVDVFVTTPVDLKFRIKGDV